MYRRCERQSNAVGLSVYRGLPAGAMKGLGRNPAAGVAVDAGAVDVEIAGDVLGSSLFGLGH